MCEVFIEFAKYVTWNRDLIIKRFIKLIKRKDFIKIIENKDIIEYIIRFNKKIISNKQISKKYKKVLIRALSKLSIFPY